MPGAFGDMLRYRRLPRFDPARQDVHCLRERIARAAGAGRIMSIEPAAFLVHLEALPVQVARRCGEERIWSDRCQRAADEEAPPRPGNRRANGRCRSFRLSPVFARDPDLSLIHISEPTRPELVSRMPSSA